MVARLGLPPRERETDSLAFGSAVHAVLEQCHAPDADVAALAGPAASAAGLAASEVPRLERAAAAFLASRVAAEALGAPVVMHEAPIAVPVAGSTLVGSIDLFARSGDRALVVDYKTGVRPLSVDDAERRYRLQAECYALAALTSGADEVAVVFAELERGREIPFEFRSADRAALSATISGIIDRMRTDLQPRDDYEEGLCESCPGFGGMCPMARPPAGAAG
jgi:RecB family exonuclease